MGTSLSTRESFWWLSESSEENNTSEYISDNPIIVEVEQKIAEIKKLYDSWEQSKNEYLNWVLESLEDLLERIKKDKSGVSFETKAHIYDLRKDAILWLLEWKVIDYNTVESRDIERNEVLDSLINYDNFSLNENFFDNYIEEYKKYNPDSLVKMKKEKIKLLSDKFLKNNEEFENTVRNMQYFYDANLEYINYNFEDILLNEYSYNLFSSIWQKDIDRFLDKKQNLWITNNFFNKNDLLSIFEKFLEDDTYLDKYLGLSNTSLFKARIIGISSRMKIEDLEYFADLFQWFNGFSVWLWHRLEYILDWEYGAYNIRSILNSKKLEKYFKVWKLNLHELETFILSLKYYDFSRKKLDINKYAKLLDRLYDKWYKITNNIDFLTLASQLDTIEEFWLEDMIVENNISNFSRFTKEDLIRLKNDFEDIENKDRKIALLVFSKSDHNWVFSIHKFLPNKKIPEDYKIVYYEVNWESDFYGILDRYKWAEQKIDLMVLAWHGNEDLVQLGWTPKRDLIGVNLEESRDYYLSSYDEQYLTRFDSDEISSFVDSFWENSNIILHSCIAWKWEKSTAKAISSALWSNVTIYGADESIQNTNISFWDWWEIKSVEFWSFLQKINTVIYSNWNLFEWENWEQV